MSTKTHCDICDKVMNPRPLQIGMIAKSSRMYGKMVNGERGVDVMIATQSAVATVGGKPVEICHECIRTLFHDSSNPCAYSVQ